MATLKFLCDEDVKQALIACLLRIEPGILIVAIGQQNAPPKGTPDPEILLWAEHEGYTVLSRDRSTMLQHEQDHRTAGHRTWGVIFLRTQFSWQEIADVLLLIWSASQAEEWQDRIEYIPW